MIAECVLLGLLSSKYNEVDTEEFLSFLNCKIVNEKAFEQYSTDLEDLSSHINSLKICTSFYIVYVFFYLRIINKYLIMD